MATPSYLPIIMNADWRSLRFQSVEMRDLLIDLAADPNAYQRQEDIQRVGRFIGSQQLITERTYLVTPILIHLLQNPEVPNKQWLIQALTGVHFNYVYSSYQADNALAMYHLVFPVHDIIVHYLDSSDVKTRMAAATLVSRFLLHPDMAAPLLAKQIQKETNLADIQTLILDLRYLMTECRVCNEQLKQEIRKFFTDILYGDNAYLGLLAGSALIKMDKNAIELAKLERILELIESRCSQLYQHEGNIKSTNEENQRFTADLVYVSLAIDVDLEGELHEMMRDEAHKRCDPAIVDFRAYIKKKK